MVVTAQYDPLRHSSQLAGLPVISKTLGRACIHVFPSLRSELQHTLGTLPRDSRAIRSRHGAATALRSVGQALRPERSFAIRPPSRAQLPPPYARLRNGKRNNVRLGDSGSPTWTLTPEIDATCVHAWSLWRCDCDWHTVPSPEQHIIPTRSGVTAAACSI